VASHTAESKKKKESGPLHCVITKDITDTGPLNCAITTGTKILQITKGDADVGPLNFISTKRVPFTDLCNHKTCHRLWLTELHNHKRYY